MKILAATNNAGKLREIRALLSKSEVVSPVDLGLHLEVDETGTTFVANATLKAQAFAKATNLIALADDSGLEVDALGGAPGVYSARYGGPSLDAEGRWRLLLKEMEPFTATTERSARFRCAMVAFSADGRTCRAEGTCEGRIACEAVGQNGFGYDPIFFLPELHCTMAELDASTKNSFSHRANALTAIHPLLMETFPELRT
ncbi:MAG: XTP/dITP diphosphohydrolase [Candidatus Latescibacterota bacterium]